jgi:hypothetical protein
MYVLNFLGEFQANSLLTDVNMSFLRIELNKRTWLGQALLLLVLTKIVSFITSIDSLEFLQINLFKMVYNNNTNHGNSHESLLQWIWKMIYIDNKTKMQLLLNEMMTQTRILVINWLVVIIHALLSNLLMIF